MNSMNGNENIPFDQIPQLHTESFLTKEQAEQFRDTFKNLTVVVRCRDCKHWLSPGIGYKNADLGRCMGRGHGLQKSEFFCADGERRSE